MVIFKNAKTVRHEFSVYGFSYILRRLLRYFENFATASRLRCQQNSSRSSLLTTSATVDASCMAVYYTSVDSNSLTPLHRSVADLW